MVVFLIALKPREKANSWDKVIQLLANTLNSICNQKDSRYKVIVIANEVINLSFKDVVFLQTDTKTLGSGFLECETDRAAKLHIGFEYCKRYNPNYVMIFDADDFVSNKLVSYLHTFNMYDCHLVKGYSLANNEVIKIEDFNLYCGTSIIIKPQFFNILFINNIYDHVVINYEGLNIKRTPFYSVIYNRLNGENYMIGNLVELDIGRGIIEYNTNILSNSIKKEFNIN